MGRHAGPAPQDPGPEPDPPTAARRTTPSRAERGRRSAPRVWLERLGAGVAAGAGAAAAARWAGLGWTATTSVGVGVIVLVTLAAWVAGTVPGPDHDDG